METLVSCYTFSSSSSLGRLNSIRRNKKRGKKQEKQARHQKQGNISYPKSCPTPFLISQTPYTQTKLQALDVVVKDLQTSIERGVLIDIEIFSSLVETCYQIESLQHAIQIHHLIPPFLLRNSLSLSSKLLHLYASFGLVHKAQQLFDEMPRRNHTCAFPWNSLISAYTQLGQYEDAMALYFQMEEEGVHPDHFTFPRVLRACAGLGSIQIGQAIHLHIVRYGFISNAFALNALVHMYAKCGDIVKARKVFDNITVRDSVSWNSMLTAYLHHQLLAEALDVFRCMLADGCEPDSVAISAILSKFSSSSALVLQLHAWVLRRGINQNLSIANSLIACYSEQGKLDRTRWLFEMMPQRDVVSWNSIISAHRKDPKVLHYFEQMEDSNVLPDAVTFVSLLSACTHLGLVEYGRQLLTKMKDKFRIKPRMEHYACMVNLLGRAGLIGEAYEIITKQMEIKAGPTVWGALLYACSLHGNVDVGKIAAERLFEFEPDNARNFELLVKIYRNACMWEEVEKVMQVMVDRGLDS